MATLVGIKVPRKKVRAAPRVQRGSKMKEPSWDGWETWSGEQYHSFQRQTHTWYYENFKPADLYPAVHEWMKKNGYTAQQIKHAKAASSSKLSVTAGILAKMLINGMPDYNPKHDEYWQSLAGTTGDMKPKSVFLRQKVEESIEEGSKIVEVVEVVEEKNMGEKYILTIQERLRQASMFMTEFMEQALDDFNSGRIDSFKDIKITNQLRALNCKQPHARMIQNFYAPQMEELREVLNPPKLAPDASEYDRDWAAQLQEGYLHWDRKNLKQILDFYVSVCSACDAIIAESKATRKPRKISAKAPEKVVAKMKYKISDEKYAISSIQPHKLVGASCLVVFNAKMRKLGIYYTSVEDPSGAAREGSGLTVKGTTLQRFDEERSVWSTLRKPMDQLQEVKDLNTRKKFENWFGKLTTTPVKMNGRINEETILIAVY